MADQEYRPRACAVDGCDGRIKAHGYCLRHYRQLQRGGIKPDPTNCAFCGASIAGKSPGTLYCSGNCKVQAWAKANPQKWQELQAAKVCKVHAAYCQVCGTAFVSRKASKTCSKECRRLVARQKQASKPKQPHRLGVRYTPPIRTCDQCGRQWSAIKRVGSSPCCPTPECLAASRKAAKKAAKSGKGHVSRAKSKGREYSYFDVTKVLRRDKWRCQLCGQRTPKELRGTEDPHAPEIDHIVPIAAGGNHLPENCQCACRRCNSLKGARPAGQLWLQGFAST